MTRPATNTATISSTTAAPTPPPIPAPTDDWPSDSVLSSTFAVLASPRELVAIKGELELVGERASELVIGGVSVLVKGMVCELVREGASELVVD